MNGCDHDRQLPPPGSIAPRPIGAVRSPLGRAHGPARHDAPDAGGAP